MRKEIDSLKASLLDLKKRFDEIEKSQNVISKNYELTDVKEHNEGVKNQIKEIQGRQKTSSATVLMSRPSWMS